MNNKDAEAGLRYAGGARHRDGSLAEIGSPAKRRTTMIRARRTSTNSVWLPKDQHARSISQNTEAGERPTRGHYLW